MLIKEYRICLPLTVEEYRIAQLYMIQKKSQQESTGAGSGVEIIINRPYTDGPGGNGQYTFKIYHVGSHLPNWFRNIIPKNALVVEEEAWNAYPYTKTIYKVPFIEKFMIELETVYFNDAGIQDNVFNLKDEELRNRIVDYIDIVCDPISSGDYKVEEDPKIYQSSVTKRGPLTESWCKDYEKAVKTDSTKSIMCAYKLCKIEFRYWGMQTKIEKFIDDIGLRKTMVRAHRQAWCWQDEWYGLTIEDIRNLEAKAQQVLAKTMGQENEHCLVVDEKINEHESTENIAHQPTSIESIQRKDSSEDEFDDEECFEDARSELPSETDSFMTCKNTFASNLTLHIDPITGARLTNSPNSKKSVLVLVLHGGSLLDTSHEYHNKNSDVSTLRQTFDNVIKTTYPQLKDRISLKLIACPSAVSDVLNNLNRLTPQTCDQYYQSTISSQPYVPLAAIPLFLTESGDYNEIINTIRDSMNDRYNEFLRSEGLFESQVNIIADAIGSLFLYDILNPNKSNNSQSTDSYTEYEVGHLRKSVDMERRSVMSNDSSNALTTSVMPLDFPVIQVFLLGSPLGLVLAYRNQKCKLNIPKNFTTDTITELHLDEQEGKKSALIKPLCRQIYNIFHQTDPSAYRLEPLINFRLHNINPMNIPNYSHHQYNINLAGGNDESLYLIETLFNNPGIVSSDTVQLTINKDDKGSFEESALSRFLHRADVRRVVSEWWGEKRVDYCLHTPEGVQNLPLGALPHLLHASYWESRDCVAFVLRQIMESVIDIQDFDEVPLDGDNASSLVSFDDDFGIKNKRRSKSSSLKFKTMCVPYKINVSINHRANDVIVLAGQSQVITARFMYGVLDIVTPKNEKVDVYIMNQPIGHGNWEKEGTDVTDSSGRVKYHIPESRRLREGIYPVRMVLRSDWSAVDFHMAVLPPNVEIVVFSIDGSFAATVSLSGKDPKIRAGCIDVARFWQERGYLLVYISARPSIQQRHVQRWLADHKFPLGMLLFSESVSREPLKHKMNILSRLINNVQIKIHCAYGSAKDISIYQSLGLHSHQIFTIGRLTKNQKVNTLSIKRGYAIHLNDLLRKDNPIGIASRSLANIPSIKSSFQHPVRHVNINSAVYRNSEVNL